VNAEDYIAKYKLIKHPEGGYFTEFYKASAQVKPLVPQYNNELRSAGSSIYFLLDKKDFSAWHSLKSDEIWHFLDCFASLAMTLVKKNFKKHIFNI
jgi:predicted cupin superfamily sugar epimerase